MKKDVKFEQKNIENPCQNEQDTNHILKYALDHGILDLPYIQEQIEMSIRKDLLKQHQYKIWCGKDGKWYTYLPDSEKGRILKKRTTKKEIEDLVINYLKQAEVNPTIEEVYNEWNNRKLKLQQISYATYNRNAAFFKRHFQEIKNKRMKDLTKSDVINFLEEQIPKCHLTAKGFSGLLGVTKGFLKYAKIHEYTKLSVTDIIDSLDISECSFTKHIREDSDEVFNTEEMDKMMTYLQNNLDRWNIGLLLMFVTGMRVGELATLKHSDFDYNAVRIRRTETLFTDLDGKKHYDVKDFPKSAAGVRTIIIPQNYYWLLDTIKLLNPFGEYVFVNNKGERMTTNCFRHRLYNLCEQLGIKKKSPHKIRKTYGTILLDNHLDQKFIMSQMGHTDIACTEAHYHRDRRDDDEKARIISNIPDFRVC